MNPGSVVSADRAPPPGVLFASSTTTLHPACARTIAALRPFGPAPMTMASIMRRNAQGFAASDTVNVLPAIVRVPVRRSPLLAATEKFTLPFPVPLAGLTPVIHVALLAA